MPLKKSELYSSIWQSCDELRGGMDASQYKDYVLVLLFVKYVSDRYAGQRDSLLDVPKGGSFSDMVALKGDKEIGDKMNKIIGKLAEANDLKGIIDTADFNDEGKLGKGKDMVDRLSNLVSIFDNPSLDFRSNRAEGDDLLGDAYEFLMRHFATESGKSKGQFYTPAEVSRIIAKVIGIGKASRSNQTLYDPTCGSGSLLLKAHDEAAPVDVTIYGQENDVATAGLAKMNMILHGCATAEIARDNTLSAPRYKETNGRLKSFDFVVANPPFSNKNWTNGLDPLHDEYHRFEFGIPPTKNGDYAFLLQVLTSLKSTGKGAIILPHGVLFRGGAEGDIRRNIIQRGYIKGIIGLPPNLFFGTGIPACIVVLDKQDSSNRAGIFIIDASKGFIKDGNKNRLREQDIHKIVDTFNNERELPRYSRLVPIAEISDPKNDFNLNLPRYIDSGEPEDFQDIDGHLRGGIPDRDIDALANYWDVIPSVRKLLFESAGRKGYSNLRPAVSEVKAKIFEHPEFTAFNKTTTAIFEKWKKTNLPLLSAIEKGTRPKELIRKLSESLLSGFLKTPLLDAYDMYQHLMDYWAGTMQDDVYMIASDGWKNAAKPRAATVDTKGKATEKPDFVVGKLKFMAELIPPSLLIARYFKAEQAAIEKLESEIATLETAIDTMSEEEGGEDGLFSEVSEEGKIEKKKIAPRIKQIKGDSEFNDERKALNDYLSLLEQVSDPKGRLKDALTALDEKIAQKFGIFSEEDIKSIVVIDKWLGAIEAALQSELASVSQRLTGRVTELAERYVEPLPQIISNVVKLSQSVDVHLKKMGALWK
jgi:type I restriction enzyme M protein